MCLQLGKAVGSSYNDWSLIGGHSAGSAGGAAGGDGAGGGQCPAASPKSPEECDGVAANCWSPGIEMILFNISGRNISILKYLT